MENFHKVIIVGAGPIGLYFATKCEKAGIDYIVLETTENAGGQITNLYPEKEIVDIPGIASIKAKDFISNLLKEIDTNKIHFNEQVLQIKNGKLVEISTKTNTFSCEKLIIATGLGSSKPRPLGLDGEDKCDNILYSLKNFEFLKNKRVAIFGGGDSALDWTKELSKITNDVHLIHRREEFRGNENTIKGIENISVHKPYIPRALNINKNKATSVVIEKVDEQKSTIEIDVDYILVTFGNVASPSSFTFPMQGSFLLVNNDFEIEKNIFAIGDVAQYENKTRRLAPGINEANKVFDQII